MYAQNAQARPDLHIQTFCYDGTDFGLVMLVMLFNPIIISIATLAWVVYFHGIFPWTWCGKGDDVVYLTLGLSINTAMCFALKLMIRQPPPYEGCDDTFGIVPFGMPSWPNQFMCFFGGYTWAAFVRKENRKWERRFKSCLLPTIVVMTFISSITSGYNSPLQAVVGCVAGGVLCLIYLFHFGIVKMINHKNSNAMLAHVARTQERRDEFKMQQELVATTPGSSKGKGKEKVNTKGNKKVPGASRADTAY